MTKFEKIGMDYQYGARSARRAKQALEKSCKICATTGKHIECKHCAIANAHNDIILILTKGV